MRFFNMLLAVAAIASVVVADEPKDNKDDEKDRYIYGKPGDEDYGTPRSADDVIRLERMWTLDLNMQKTRGFLQGYHRGMYKDFDYMIPEKCLAKESTMQIYYVEKIFKSFQFEEIGTVSNLAYNIYYNVDFECEIEKYLYDMACFCFDHDCSFETLYKNELSKVLQVTGVLNSIAAVLYGDDPQPKEDDHVQWFELYSQIGSNVGKLVRYTFAFNPAEIHY